MSGLYFKKALSIFPNSGIRVFECKNEIGFQTYVAGIEFFADNTLNQRVLIFRSDPYKSELTAINAITKFIYTEETYLLLAKTYVK